ncbi:MAG: pirin-like C-terminal cupin domain-containing protein, partial [Cyclobacteriaceae bacterium]
PVHSELFMVEVKVTADYQLDISGKLEGEIGICIVEGAIDACENHVTAGNMLVSKADGQCDITIKAGSHLLLFGGLPLPEERYIYWNFVSSNKERLERAKEDWRNRKFPKVAGDNTYVPLP